MAGVMTEKKDFCMKTRKYEWLVCKGKQPELGSVAQNEGIKAKRERNESVKKHRDGNDVREGTYYFLVLMWKSFLSFITSIVG